MPINYSKWDKIEVSDDEDDTHPNVDTPSLFRWRHQARVDREEALTKKRIDIDREGDRLKAKLAKDKKMTDEQKTAQLSEWKKKEREIAEEERKAPQSVDTLSKDVKSQTKTHINKPAQYENYDAMTDKEKEESYKKFNVDNKQNVKDFGYLRDPVQSQEFLNKNRQLICEHTSNILVVWCIDLEMEEKTALMKHVASQCICMQFILELAKGIKRHPSECFPLFYQKYIEAKRKKDSADKSDRASVEYYQAFESELNAFIDRVQKRAKVKMIEVEQEIEAAEKQQRISESPGGLDPQEVMDSLPEELKDCFRTRSIESLQTLLKDDTEKYLPWIQKCVLSGLWVPGKDSPLYKLIATPEEVQEIERIHELEADAARASAQNAQNAAEPIVEETSTTAAVQEVDGQEVVDEQTTSEKDSEDESTQQIETETLTANAVKVNGTSQENEKLVDSVAKGDADPTSDKKPTTCSTSTADEKLTQVD